jgi:putative tryptophan/tyrosine transport system substrate-binding protein
MRLIRVIYALRNILIIAAVIACNAQAIAGDPRIAVLYPEASGGYKQVFSNMVSGVEEHGDIDVISLELPKHPNAKTVNDWLLENRVDSVIALGSTSYAIAPELPDNIPVTVGALVMSPDDYSGISLAGDPALFMEHLRTLAPEVRRVYIIYSKKDSEWLVKLAEESARKTGIELVAHEVDSTRQGMQQYDKVLEQASGATDAIWLPLDSIVPDKLILPKLLKTAWDKKIVVFSNNPLHVKKGILFALFPDHKNMGFDLAKLAIEQIGVKLPLQVLPARNLKLAVNKRTASHLGFSYSKNQQRQFDIIFPSE